MSQEQILPVELPVVPIKNTVLFPNLLMPLSVGRPKSVAAIQAALASEGKDEARARVRVAADKCADPGVRVVLARIAADDEEEDEPAIEGPPLEFAFKRTTLEGR